MKVLFCVFSGTGNTLMVAKKIGEELKSLGHETEFYSVRADSSAPDVQADLVVFGYPVHAFNAPKPMLRFLKTLKANGQKTYLIRTSGEPLGLNDASGITPRRILKKRGFDVLGEFSFVMPYNIIFRHTDEMAARMWQSAKIRAHRAAGQMSELGRNRRKVNPFKRAVAFTLRIEHVAMPMLGKHFKTTDKCIGCGKCVSLCPLSNIVLTDGKPVFGKNCSGCMACAFGCPADAIKTSLLNGWRVNGKYYFGDKIATDDEVCSYCHKSYVRYFRENEKDLQASDADSGECV